jgi:hypothetical protein
MVALSMLLASMGLAEAADGGLAEAFTEAAEEFSVPEPLLLALAYEASRWDPDVTSQWGGYGLFDLREPGEGGPNIERAAELLSCSPDDLIGDPTQQVRAAAVLLADTARRAPGGAPDPADLIDWRRAVTAFSYRHEPNLQQLFADYIFSLLAAGVADDGSGLAIAAHALPASATHSPPPPPPPGSSCDYSGCYQFTSASSSNYSDYSRSTSDVRYIVVHTVQGSYAGCISWFQNSTASVSAHYVVRSSDGQVTQMVREQDVAWHAGNWDYNLASVGIEHEGYVDAPSTWYTDAMFAGSGALSADIAARNSIPISRSYIIGHNEVPGATHTDPGSGWDWDAYLDAISGGDTVTGNLFGIVAAEDIYTGATIPDATVWIEETGEEAATDGEGYYRFYDLPLDTYTVHATADGYTEGTCTKSISIGDSWCSIALMPGEDDPAPDPEDTGSVDDRPGTQSLNSFTPPPGDAVSLSELGCSATGASGLLAWLLALPLLARRQSRGDGET